MSNDAVDMTPQIGQVAALVLLVLCRCADRNTGKCWPSQATLAARVGCSKKTVKRAVETLKEYRLISVKKRFKSTGEPDSSMYCVKTVRGGVTTLPTVGSTGNRGGDKCDTGVGSTGNRGGVTTLPEQDSKNNTNRTRLKTPAVSSRKADKPVAFPDALDTLKCRAVWREWLAYKSDIKKPYKSTRSQTAQLTRQSKLGADRFCQAVEYSIAQGYQGIFEETNGKADSPVAAKKMIHRKFRKETP